jgi:hypothetical protein
MDCIGTILTGDYRVSDGRIYYVCDVLTMKERI